MSQLSADLLASFDASTRDVNEACLLPPLVYTSDEFFAFEQDAISGHEWLCVGRADQVPEPGDWYAYEMVIAEGSGNTSKFTCPYHHWSYAFDGRLLGTPAMEQAVDFDKSCHGLPSMPPESTTSTCKTCTPTRWCNAGCAPASHRAVGIRGRKARCRSSTGGSSSGTEHIGRARPREEKAQWHRRSGACSSGRPTSTR